MPTCRRRDPGAVDAARDLAHPRLLHDDAARWLRSITGKHLQRAVLTAADESGAVAAEGHCQRAGRMFAHPRGTGANRRVEQVHPAVGAG